MSCLMWYVWLARPCDVEVVKTLLKEGNRSSLVDQSHYSVMHYAVTSPACQVGTLQILVESGADSNVRNRCGRTVLGEYLER